ncbi:putative snf2 family helicase [Phaeomoniella chlamydospora]|uniref:Putative snf2 family helicase n=1 Tax=Phaeomoniella chlamydospora TaxID=158046 RepID=A0A0G2H6Q3_PHACM|nr:putative snf2 family helicase [Phaeomoniella chlamydospora]
MVNEREPPQKPLSPKHNVQNNQRPTVPEFGKPTAPASPLPQRPRQNDPEAALFNRPRPGHSRPEHHRPVTHNPLAAARDWAREQVHKITEPQTQPRPPSRPPQNEFDPYHSNGFRPTSTAHSNDDVVEIPRPAGYQSWTTRAAPPPMFSSRAANMSNNFIDLTKSTSVTPTSSRFPEDGFSMADPSMYMDAGKANENLKALLEGAFEDDEDKPRTRRRKRVASDKAADELAAQLEGLHVKDKEAEQDPEEEEEDGTVEGLKVKLLPHQIDGVSWMRDKETGTKKTRGVHPRGGILADDMGLGKTIQSIALMLTNPLPKDYSPEPPQAEATKKPEKGKLKLSPGLDKATLVVAPLALIKQWEAEIKDRVEDSHALRVKVHHGPQRANKSADLKKSDVVITTYQILVSEHGASEGNLRVGVFGVNWYRIILDEAHTIKNRNAKATQAAYALNAEYRWCLSGTPMQNNLDELQSLIRFLRIKPYDDLATWRDQITRPMNNGRGGLAVRRLQVYLKAFMKRRTKDILKQEGALRSGPSGETEDGKPTGFKIVKRSVEKIEAEFTDEERLFYNRLEQRTDRSLEQMMKGDALSYASALVLLLRLRQACNHPQLVKSDLAKEETFNGQTSGAQSPRKKSAPKNDEIDRIADMLGGLTVQTKRCDVCQIELSSKESSSGAIRCGECENDLADEVSAARRLKKKQKKEKKTSGKSTKNKAEKFRATAKRIIDDSDDEDEEKGEWLVPQEEQLYPQLGKAGGIGDENAEGGGEWIGSDDSENEDNQPKIRKNKQVVNHVSDSEDRSSSSEDDSEEDSSSESDEDSTDLDIQSHPSANDPIISTKINRLLQILRNDSSKHKYIVFSFFTSMLDLIEPFLKRENLAFTRYDGGMRNDLREASLDRLRNHEGTRILLCSLRAGSLGLNLTAASRVVILEPFWNPFVEEQAIDRVHRLNQTQDVIVYKLTIANTVESRILNLQDKKRELANATIEGAGAGKKGEAAKLTLGDMLALFRRDAENDSGNGVDVNSVGIGMTEKGGLMRPTQQSEARSRSTTASQSSSVRESRESSYEELEEERLKREREKQRINHNKQMQRQVSGGKEYGKEPQILEL